MLNTNGYTSRHFNVITEDSDVITKGSTHIEKINNEYKYYYYLPLVLQKYFVKPYDFKIENNIASYKMKKIYSKNLGELLYSGEITKDQFKLILDKIVLFQQECIINGGIDDCSKDDSYNLVIKKTQDRLKSLPDLKYLLDRLTMAYGEYIKERKTWNKVISHGDLCLGNILWPENGSLLLIDPRGADTPEDLYMDEYYDLAKLSHSIASGYDKIIYKINKDISNKGEIETLFFNFLKDKNISISLLRVYEASLFLSMIPLHIDDKDNMSLFAIQCDKILSEIGF